MKLLRLEYVFATFCFLLSIVKTNAQWIELGGANTSNFNNRILTINTDTKGNIYAAGVFSNGTDYSMGNQYVAKWNGMVWSEVGEKNDSIFHGYITSIANDINGNVYVGGEYKNGNGAQYVAKLNGTTWGELGGTNAATTNVDIVGITTDIIGNVYAAGSFMNEKGKFYVPKFNDTTWSELGGKNTSTFNGYINCITTDTNGNLYAAGGFTNSTGKYYVAKWNGTTWDELGGTNTSTFNGIIICITIDTNSFVYAGGLFTNENGKGYVAKYTPTTLPITIASFTAIPNNKTITTNWHTSTELNTTHFIIQHSTNGTSFTDISSANAIGSGANGYSFTDNNPTPGINYYRLKSIDKDGSSSFSKIVSVQFTVNSNQLSVFPNPSKDKVTVNGNHIVSIQVVDNLGKVTKTVSLKDATNPTLSVSGLPAGTYYLRVQTTDGKVSSANFVKE